MKGTIPLSSVLTYENGELLGYELLDNVESCQYEIPPLRSLWLEVNIRKEAPAASFQDKIEAIALRYRNARFGKVDAHIAVCAFARDALLKTARLAEEHGFEVVHGIVDSLWIKKPGVTPREVPVPKPLLWRFRGRTNKMRGIEARKSDTSPIMKEAQAEMIKALGTAKDYNEFVGKNPESLKILQRYAEKFNGKRKPRRTHNHKETLKTSRRILPQHSTSNSGKAAESGGL